jgi:hypothetical protein
MEEKDYDKWMQEQIDREITRVIERANNTLKLNELLRNNNIEQV